MRWAAAPEHVARALQEQQDCLMPSTLPRHRAHAAHHHLDHLRRWNAYRIRRSTPCPIRKCAVCGARSVAIPRTRASFYVRGSFCRTSRPCRTTATPSPSHCRVCRGGEGLQAGPCAQKCKELKLTSRRGPAHLHPRICIVRAMHFRGGPVRL